MLKRILKPLASLKLTVVLLSLSILLIYAGTWAQVDTGIWTVQKKFFYSNWVWISFQSLLPRPGPGQRGIPGGFPMLGGYILGILLLANVLTAYLTRVKFNWKDLGIFPLLALIILVGHLVYPFGFYKLLGATFVASVPLIALLFALHKKRVGVLLIHMALVLLLTGEALTSAFRNEAIMQIDEGGGTRFTQDTRHVELAVVRPTPKDRATDDVTVISHKLLEQKQPVTDSRLPFEVKVDAFYPNAEILGPMQPRPAGTLTADSGAAAQYAAVELPPIGGTDQGTDEPAAYVTLSKGGKAIGKYLFSARLNQPEEIAVGDTTYQVQLRYKRSYKPYTVYLDKFSFDRYPGTNDPRNYSSDIRLVDAAHGVDRKVHIWMNNPLRYNGETFYQLNFDRRTEKTTVLQVVSNPSWTLPYVACEIGGIGLLIHFGMALFAFLRKRGLLGGDTAVAAAPFAAPAAGLLPGKPGASMAALKGSVRSSKNPVPPALDAQRSRSYGPMADIGVPAIIAVFCCLYLISHALIVPAPKAGEFDLYAYSQLPVTFEGRTQPLDSLARNSLKIIRERETFEVNGKSAPAIQWLADVLANPVKAAQHKVFRIDYKGLAGLFSTDEQAKYFSLDELFAHWDSLSEQFQRLTPTVMKDGDLYQVKVAELRTKLRAYFRIAGVDAARTYAIFSVQDPELRQQFGLTADAKLLSLGDLSPVLKSLAADATAIQKMPLAERTPAERDELRLTRSLNTFVDLLQETGEPPLIIAPLAAGEKWMTLETAAEVKQQTGEVPAGALNVAMLIRQWDEGQVGDFNRTVTDYHRRLASKLPIVTQKADFETAFNRYDPFIQSQVLYILVFLLVCISWLGFTKPLTRTALAVLVISFLVHTGGLVARIYISGRPPVTNLASSAIFIGWAVVLLAILLQLIYRNGISMALAAIMGFCSLQIAGYLALRGDTMKVLEAVLDTNFWLATHVTSVTIGYSATFLAGFLGIVYVIVGLTTRLFEKEDSRTLAKMIYGVTCFALIFSFVGTILGGIWADQSWGRFWGWDPKENGAVLIVLSNALLLHARWGGVARDRGIAMLAIFGNIVTSWSWFGTNMLGVGLHSYGRMDSALLWLLAFVGSQVFLILLGCIPVKYWGMNRSETMPPTRQISATQPRKVATV